LTLPRNAQGTKAARPTTKLTATKKDLIARVSEKTGLDKKTAEAVVISTLDTIVDYLCEGEKVTLLGFGNYEAKLRSARTGRNPQTGQPMDIPEKLTVSFTVGKTFKDKVAESHKP
jgi:DNA-binding protein HU-beta